MLANCGDPIHLISSNFILFHFKDQRGRDIGGRYRQPEICERQLD